MLVEIYGILYLLDVLFAFFSIGFFQGFELVLQVMAIAVDDGDVFLG